MDTCKFIANLIDSNSLYNTTNWYGQIGFTFDDPELAYTYEKALKAVNDIEDIKVDYNRRSKIYIVWSTPKTAIASAIIKAIQDNFRK